MESPEFNLIYNIYIYTRHYIHTQQNTAAPSPTTPLVQRILHFFCKSMAPATKAGSLKILKVNRINTVIYAPCRIEHVLSKRYPFLGSSFSSQHPHSAQYEYIYMQYIYNICIFIQQLHMICIIYIYHYLSIYLRAQLWEHRQESPFM